MASELTKLPNIGPKTSLRLNDVSVYTLDDIRKLGVVEVYRRLRDRYPDKVTLNALWGLEGAVTNTPWNRIPDEVKQELLNQLKAVD